MQTFSHAVLFTKDDCVPCTQTKGYIRDHVPDEYKPHLSTFRKEDHTALITAYNIDLFPTLLLVNSEGIEVDRAVGGKKVRACVNQFLTLIHQAKRK